MAPQEGKMTRSCIYWVYAICPTLRSELYALSCSVRTQNVLLHVFHKRGNGRLKCETAFSKSHTIISSVWNLNLGMFVSKAHSLSLPETCVRVPFHEMSPSCRWAYRLHSGIFPVLEPVFLIGSLCFVPLFIYSTCLLGDPRAVNQYASAKTGMVATFRNARKVLCCRGERTRLWVHHPHITNVS